MEEDNSLQENNQQEKQQNDNKRKQEMAKKIAEKAGKKLAGKGSLMAPLAHILMVALPIIIALIIIVGIILFLLTMPGMAMEKLKEKLKELANFVASFYGADTTEQIDDAQIYGTLDYLEQMGYDLKGFGFLTDYVTDINSVPEDDYDNRDGAHLDPKIGVIRDKDEKIVYAKSDFIFTYIVSDNYMYTLANKNIATIKGHNDKGSNSLLDKIINLGKGIATVWYKLRNAVWGPVFDALGITEDVIDKWGTGLIKLYYDDGTIGEKEKIVNMESLWNWDSFKINVKNNTLSIARKGFLDNNNPMEFSLDGWSGRYGMPMEFLLSVHLATMMPDLAYDMATSFPTNVNIYLHKSKEGKAEVAYKTKAGNFIKYTELSEVVNGNDGHGPIDSFINWFKKLARSDQKIISAFALGIDHHEPCDCTFSEESFEETTYYIVVDENEVIVYLKDGNYYTDIDKPETKVTGVEIKSKTETITLPSGIPVKPGTKCKAYVEKILSIEKWQDDPKYKAYIPYIVSVTNHWYRDVYFVSDVNGDDEKHPNGFVDYDYDYEAITGERWTLYETYKSGNKKGDFKLYKVDEEGNTTDELYSGTIKEAQEQGIAVAKKAVKIEGNKDTYDDLGWIDNTKGKWVAYEENKDKSSTGYERLYKDAEVDAESDEDTKTIMKNLYVNVSFKGNVVQKGEGLRTETNSTIKKMFLQNQYFKYDGTAETAEIITALRKKGKYGALDKTALENSIEVEENINGKTTKTKRKASSYAGKVSLNQDSLNAFSMLENTHTMDADYIYRDFKELIVELGYFEKEELTDETPRLLQWIVPEIASEGFPNRSIDKNENEFGTMVHSKGDIKANEKNTMRAIIEKANKLTEPPEGAGSEDPIDEAIVPITTKEKTHILANSEINIIGQVASLSTTPINTLKNIGAISDIQDANYTFTASGSTGKGTKTGDLEIDGVAYEVWKQTKSTCTLYAFAFIAQAYTGESPENYLKTSSGSFINATGEGQGSNEYWSGGFLGDSFAKVGIAGKKYSPSDANVAEDVATALGEGKPVYFYGDLNASAGYHAVVLLGSEGGKVLFYDPGSGAISTYGSGSSFSANLSSLISTHFKHWIFIPDEAPTGVKKNGSTPYEGFSGNEAVVSPVTGILLDYGTYDGKDDKSSITDELYRQNVDLKYAKNPIVDPGEDVAVGGEDGPALNPEYDPSKPDLVGYAKILVLDAESYKKLEAHTKTKWKDKSLVYTETTTNDDGKPVVKARFDDDEAFKDKKIEADKVLEDWKEIDKTVYGYKEFAESYQAGGISGYIVYIDGFECYKPDEEFTEEQLETESPSKDDKLKITLDSFKKITESNIENPEEDAVMDSLYEKDETHKMASKRATEKLKATAEVKNQATSTMYVNDLIFIKEGTVLGRTITDYQLITEYRNDSYDKYRNVEITDEDGNTENGDTVIGNYLRMIFRDTDDSVVEDVEKYMKIDEGGNAAQQFDAFSVIGTVLSESEWVQMAVAYATAHNADAIFKSTSDMSTFYKTCVEKGVNPEFAFVRAIQESSLHSGNGNYWGLGTPNGSELASYGTWLETLEKYCEYLLKYQDPSSSYYSQIMKRYEERKACTENGGCDPNGYGTPDTAQGIQSIYSYLGKHEEGGSGSGGYYYMDPDRAGVTKIYATHAEFLSKCRNAGGVHAYGTETTVWEQAQYTAWQVEGIINTARNIFGEKAGTYAGK